MNDNNNNNNTMKDSIINFKNTLNVFTNYKTND